MKTDISLRKSPKCLPSTLRRRNLKTQQSPVILDLCFRQREVTWLSWRLRFRKAPFSKCFPSTDTKTKRRVFKYGLKSVFEKLHFRDGLLGLTGEIKLRFEISSTLCGRGLNGRVRSTSLRASFPFSHMRELRMWLWEQATKNGKLYYLDSTVQNLPRKCYWKLAKMANHFTTPWTYLSCHNLNDACPTPE